MGEILTIGGDENASEEYLFVAPQQIFTDSQNNIFLRDVTSVMGYISNKIKKFSAMGVYLSSIGKKGEGPGEVKSIICFCITPNDDILVYDNMNKRLTLFNNNFKDYDILKPSLNIYLKPQYILPFSNSSFIVINYVSSAEIPELFYIYDQNFLRVKEKFCNSNDIWNLKVALLRQQRSKGAVDFTVVDSTKIFLAPEYYAGVTYFLQRIDGGWVTKKIKGKKPKLKPFKEVPYSSLRSGKIKKPALSFGERGKVYAYEVRNQSVGFYNFNDSQVIHFSILDKNNKKYLLVAELFTINGEYRGFSVLKEYDSKSGPLYNVKIIGQSKNEYFLTETIDDIPVIKKVSLKML